MFGGFGGMLPLRLGGTQQNGWGATQHARMAADVVAALRTAPLATLTVLAATTPVVQSYKGQPGAGAPFAPTATLLAVGRVQLNWASVYASEIFSGGVPVSFPWVIRSAVASGHYNGAPVIATITAISLTSVIVETYRWTGSTWALSNERFSLRVSGSWLPEARIGDYDGSPDKTDCASEVEPYAWYWYQEYTAMLGSGFSREQRGLVHAKKLALARFEAAKTRASERARCNALPSTADDCLEQWVECLKVPTRQSDQRWEIRLRCTAKFKGSLGATQANVDTSLAELLGASFVSTVQQIGTDLDHPPAQTLWPGINPGPSAMDLGGGAWSSERAHLTVVMSKPPPSQLGEFLYQANVALFQQLDRLLPAKMTFNWTTSVEGFLLDGMPHADGSISQLDLDGLTPS